MTPHQVGLLDLPNELLHKITSYDPIHSSNDNLLTLSCLHPRLNAICFPIYLANHGMALSTSRTTLRFTCGEEFHYAGYDPILALSVSRQLPHIEDFQCRVNITKDRPTYIKMLLGIFESTTKLLNGLDYVDEVDLSVMARIVPNTLASEGAIAPTLKDWAQVYGSLLDKVLEKSCHSLTLSHASLDLHLHNFHILPRASSSVAQRTKASGMMGRLQWLFSSTKDADASTATKPTNSTGIVDAVSLRDPSGRWVLRCINPVGRAEYSAQVQSDILASFTPSPSTLAKTQLRALHINSGMILLPPCLSWILSVLRATCSPPSSGGPASNTLTTLSLFKMSLVGEVYKAVIPLLWSSVPLLKKLSIRRCSGLDPDLIAGFLDVCQELEEVVLTENDKPDPKYPPVPMPVLPKLRKLLAPCQWILFLLQVPLDGSSRSKSQCDANLTPLPALRHLIAYAPEMESRAESVVGEIYRSLARIHRALVQPPTRQNFESFTMYVELGVGANWAMSEQVKILGKLYPNWKNHWQVVSPGQSADIPQPLAAPDKLWINLTGPLGRLDCRNDLVAWFANFTGIKAVKLTSDTKVNGRDHHNGCSEGEMGKQVELLVELLRESHVGRNVQVADCPSDPDDQGTCREIQLV